MKNEDSIDIYLRPSRIDEYIGQSKVKENLKVYIRSAAKRNETLDHVLLYGPPGLGKTTLASIIANEMGGNLSIISGSSIEKTGDLASILSALKPGDILFIDEIHRMPKIVEEVLYQAMEDFSLPIVLQRDNSSTVLTIDIAPFTLVGATTKIGLLSSPLRSRFSITQKLDFYDEDSLKEIILRTSRVLKFPIDENTAFEIAKRSRGTPRIANNLFKRIRDFSQYKNAKIIDKKTCLESFEKLGIDDIGLEEIDILYLKLLKDIYLNKPVGLETIALNLSEDPQTVEEVYEPFLIQKGLIFRTLKGRVLTQKGKDFLENKTSINV